MGYHSPQKITGVAAEKEARPIAGVQDVTNLITVEHINIGSKNGVITVTDEVTLKGVVNSYPNFL